MQFVKDLLEAAGGVGGLEGGSTKATPSLPPGYDLLLPFPEARRDSRFSVTLTGAPPPKEDDRIGQVVWQFFNYTQEMQAAESLGSVLWMTGNMPWDFYFDLARHCYDEVRHSKLAETRLEGLGHHVTDFPCSVAAYAWRQLVDPLRSYCALTYVIETGAFKYKHETYQKHLEAGDIESAEAVLFDITDETIHVGLGKSGCRRCSSLVATMERWTISWMSAGSWSSNTRSIRCNARRPRVSDLATYAVD